jgi:hypothetical protein
MIADNFNPRFWLFGSCQVNGVALVPHLLLLWFVRDSCRAKKRKLFIGFLFLSRTEAIHQTYPCDMSNIVYPSPAASWPPSRNAAVSPPPGQGGVAAPDSCSRCVPNSARRRSMSEWRTNPVATWPQWTSASVLPFCSKMALPVS